MSDSAYETVYRISILDQEGALWLPIFGLVMVFVIIWGARRVRTPESERKRWLRWIICDWPWLQIAGGTLGLLLCLVCLAVGLVRTAEALHAYRSHKYNVSEGAAEVLHRQPEAGHDQGDIIRVGDSQFEINHFRYTPGYAQTIAHGGVLTEGAYVRVFHYKGTILRIDVRKRGQTPVSE